MISKLSVSLSTHKNLSENKGSQLSENLVQKQLILLFRPFLKTVWAWKITFWLTAPSSAFKLRYMFVLIWYFFWLHCWNMYYLWQKYTHRQWKMKRGVWIKSSGHWDDRCPRHLPTNPTKRRHGWCDRPGRRGKRAGIRAKLTAWT